MNGVSIHRVRLDNSIFTVRMSKAIGEHFDRVSSLILMNNAVNVCTLVFCVDLCYYTFGEIPRSGDALLYDKRISNF